jgi:hypothetical protein
MRAGDPPGVACRRAVQRLTALVPLHKIGNQGTNTNLGSGAGAGAGAGGMTMSAVLSQETLGSQETMHTTLVVGVVAMDVQGNVSGRSRRACVCMYVCVYVCMYVCVCVYMYVCMYVCMYVFIYGCLYVCILECMYVPVCCGVLR